MGFRGGGGRRRAPTTSTRRKNTTSYTDPRSFHLHGAHAPGKTPLPLLVRWFQQRAGRAPTLFEGLGRVAQRTPSGLPLGVCRSTTTPGHAQATILPATLRVADCIGGNPTFPNIAACPQVHFRQPAALKPPDAHTPNAHANKRSVGGLPQTLKQACSQVIPRSAMCVQRFDDSLSSAIHITYRISLRSSSLQ